MIFVLPVRTSIKPWRTPYMNYALIALNVSIFLFTIISPAGPEFVNRFMLSPANPSTSQFISYAFLHSGFMHLIGNMFFLYLFGNNVNDKLGNIGYLCFYLAGGVFSAIGHILIRSSPVVGASGAIAAVTGAYLVLFPQTLVTVFYWIIYIIDSFEVSALYFIAFKLIFWDNVIERRITNVAYDAHLSGYAFGILSMLGLLSLGVIAQSPFDLSAMIKRWNRRRIYKDVVSSGYDPFTGGRPWKKVDAKVTEKPEEIENNQKIQQIRDSISARLSERNPAAAANLYLELIKINNTQLLPRQHLLDIANQLVSEGKYNEAALAYESFLGAYGNYEYIEQIQLMLGLIYSRYINNPQLAVKHLEIALPKLLDSTQLKMCREEIAKIKS